MNIKTVYNKRQIENEEACTEQTRTVTKKIYQTGTKMGFNILAFVQMLKRFKNSMNKM